MLIAHLPSGYLLGRSLPTRAWVMPAALAGAVFPDLDIIWFYLIDDRAVHHHRYWLHMPLFGLAIAAAVVPAAWYSRWRLAVVAFFVAILMHLLLDSIGGGILWGLPFSDRLYALVEVPATQSHWVASFVLHWTFVPELAIWVAAIRLWMTRGRG